MRSTGLILVGERQRAQLSEDACAYQARVTALLTTL
jgi:hypothetical protein